MTSNAGCEFDADSDVEPQDSSHLTAEFSATHGLPEWRRLSGSHGRKP